MNSWGVPRLKSDAPQRQILKSLKSLYGADMIGRDASLEVLTFLVKDQAFKLSRHCGNRSRHPLEGSFLEKYLSNSFSRLCPTDSLFVGRSVINTPPSSKFLKREPSKGPEAQNLF
jgi:hypothetical protein